MLYGSTHQCQLLTLVASDLSSTIQRGSPSPHLAMAAPKFHWFNRNTGKNRNTKINRNNDPNTSLEQCTGIVSSEAGSSYNKTMILIITRSLCPEVWKGSFNGESMLSCYYYYKMSYSIDQQRVVSDPLASSRLQHCASPVALRVTGADSCPPTQGKADVYAGKCLGTRVSKVHASASSNYF